MMKKQIKRYFWNGVLFLRDNKQLWLTAVVGIVIITAFLFIALRFTMIAQQAQEELVQTRVGSILDAFVLLAPEAIDDQDRMREYLESIKEQNPTIDSFTIFAEHGNNAWRTYVSAGGPREGTVVEDLSVVLNFAHSDPSNAFTFESEIPNGRQFTTARAIVNAQNTPIAIAVIEQGMAEIDKQITDNIRMGMYTLVILLLIITFMFFRHAHIVDFATLYRKQLEVDKMKDSFISMASHELKTPLSIIRGYVEFLKNETREAERQTYLKRIDISAEELRRLVDDILDVTRIESGNLRFSAEEIHPYPVLEDVFETFKQQAEKKGLRFILDVPEDAKAVTIKADSERLKQAIMNIVSNALKYTFHGEVIISQHVEKDGVMFTVEDTGIGMTAKQQKRLFEKFYRAEASESKDVSGTGLGLWIAKQLIEYMGGSILIESIKGKGSKFIINLPR